MDSSGSRNAAKADGSAEADRLGSLRGYGILDTPPEAIFDELVAEAAREMDTPIALISLVDENRQWFKARIGLDAPETPRSVSFCAYAIEGDETMVVPNALQDERFRDNPLVQHDPAIRFYAGTPLVAETGHRLGTLCVIDRVPRAGLSEKARGTLEALAEKAMTILEDRRRARGPAAIGAR